MVPRIFNSDRWKNELTNEAWHLDHREDNIYIVEGTVCLCCDDAEKNIWRNPKRIRLEFPDEFPFKGPLVQFPDNDVTHSCIMLDKQGRVVLDVWSNNTDWSPICANIRVLMLTIIAMLAEKEKATKKVV